MKIIGIIGFVIIAFLLIGCSNRVNSYKEHWSNYSHKELLKVAPISLEDCYAQLDTVLSERAYLHFKNLDERTAVLEISTQIGYTFIYRWYLNTNVSVKKPIHIRKIFHGYGISDPLEIIRIIFLSYHRRINNKDYRISSAIEFYSRFWIKSNRLTSNHYWTLNEEIKKMEDSIYNVYIFKKRQIDDTLTVSYYYAGHRFTKKPISYSIHGVVMEMDSVNYNLKLKLIQIENEKQIPIWYNEREVREVGDVLTVKPMNWYSKKDKLFRYR